MKLSFDQLDLADIKFANDSGGNAWYNPVLNRLKRKIKESFMSNDFAQCCYCAKSFVGEFYMVIDVEHILPQSEFESERFNPYNLNIACKRCNMQIKKADTSFIVDINKMGTDYYNTTHYKLVHPNLDVYTMHILIINMRIGTFVINKYILHNENKAKFTYEYFKLNELEIDNINLAQGIKPHENISDNIPDLLKMKFSELLTKIQ